MLDFSDIQTNETALSHKQAHVINNSTSYNTEKNGNCFASPEPGFL